MRGQFRQSGFRLAVAWSLPVWLAIAAYGWSAANNNAQDGWSIAKIRLGLVAPPPGGDLADMIGEQVWVKADLSAHGRSTDQRVLVVRQRTRKGLFVPWIETTGLRMASATGSLNDMHSGTTSPAWPGILRTVRRSYASGTTPQHRVIVDEIDAQLAGTLPRRKFAGGPLALECLVIFAHAMTAVSLLCVLGAVRRHRLVLARRAQGLCLNCGYAHSGVLGTCPECGVRARRRYQYR